MLNNLLIDIKGMNKNFFNTEYNTNVLSNFDFKVPTGSFISIMGKSGVGKSTLLNIIGLLDNKFEGTYFFNGKDVSSLNDDLRANERLKSIGFIFQNYKLLSEYTVMENVTLPNIYSKKKLDKTRLYNILNAVGLKDKYNLFPNNLSGGQQQRVAIARALINDPKIIIADEPTGALDEHTSHLIMNLLVELNKAGQTIIMVTHDQEMASYANEQFELIDGKLIVK